MMPCHRGDGFQLPTGGFGVVLATNEERGVALVRMQNGIEGELALGHAARLVADTSLFLVYDGERSIP